jgi:hypothetical protein
MQRFAKELIALRPDLLVSNTTPATTALLQQTRTIPIVFASLSDPIGSGLVDVVNVGGVGNTFTLGNGNRDVVNVSGLGSNTFTLGNGTGDTVTISGGAGGDTVKIAGNDAILTDTSGDNADILKGTGTGDVFSDGHGDATLKLITTGGMRLSTSGWRTPRPSRYTAPPIT